MSKNNKWVKVKFEDIVENIADRIDKPSESGLKYYIGLDHLDTDQIRIKRFGSTADVNATKFLCKKGDIIFGKRNAYLRKVAVSDRDAVVSAHAMIFRPKNNLINTEFLPCLLQSSTFWKTAHAISEGSMSPTIKWKILAKQEFSIPVIEEQKKISEILWAIEDNIKKIEKLIEVNEELKKGLLNELLSKGIGHKKFKKTDFGKTPEEWNFDILSNLIAVNPRRELKQNSKAEYIAMEDIIEHQENIQNKTIRIFKGGGSRFSNGDTIFARITPCLENGKTAYVDILDNKVGFGSTEFIVLSGIEKKTLNKYVYYLAISPFIRKSAINSMRGTTGRQRVPNDFFDLVKIGIPSIGEQKKIIDIFAVIDKVLFELKSYITKLYKLKKKLTDDILSGKIRISKKVN